MTETYDIKVKCSRCRNIHLESERKKKPSRELRGGYDYVCPRCACTTYFRISEESTR